MYLYFELVFESMVGWRPIHRQQYTLQYRTKRGMRCIVYGHASTTTVELRTKTGVYYVLICYGAQLRCAELRA